MRPWILIMLLFCGACYAEDWKELKGEHFVIYYLENENFAREVLSRAEIYYQRIALDLGYSRYDNFWQWENRAKIYIYRGHGEFLRATGKKKWVHGTVIYDSKEIISYEWGEGFLDALLPHELAHIIFRDFVGFPTVSGAAPGEKAVPLWLDEGVAQWEEEKKREKAAEIVKRLMKDKAYIPLRELARIGKEAELDPVVSEKLYAEAASLVGYLIKEYGGTRFTLFCRQLRDGKSLDEALSSAYTDYIRDIDDLEAKWVKKYGG